MGGGGRAAAAAAAVEAPSRGRRACILPRAQPLNQPSAPALARRVAGCCRIGTEHEKLGYNVADTRRLTYEQIAELLRAIQVRESGGNSVC